jgi:hypothetical protein
MVSSQTQASERILRRFKGLSEHLQPDERPLFTIPAIWDNGRSRHSTACDVILTNARLFGYIYTRYPHERFFLDALPLNEISVVSLRQKSFEPVFRELLVGSQQRRVYIRAPRQKIERLYEALRSAIARFAPGAQVQGMQGVSGERVEQEQEPSSRAPAYGKQEIRAPFERSSLAITLLFVGGLILEIGGALLWYSTQSFQVGFPPIFAGLVAVGTAILIARQRR